MGRKALTEEQKQVRKVHKLALGREYDHKRDATPERRKYKRIYNWKYLGIKHHDYDELYEIYLNTTHCKDCNCELNTYSRINSQTKVVDHDHSTGEFRDIVCSRCNYYRGYLDNFIL